MSERGEFGSVRIGGENVPLTLRGYVVLLVVGGVGLAGVVWGVLVLTIFAFSPLYG